MSDTEKIIVIASVALLGWIAYAHTVLAVPANETSDVQDPVVPWQLTYNYPEGFTAGGGGAMLSSAMPQLATGQENTCSICTLMGGNQF